MRKLKQVDLNAKISRKEIADIMGVTVNTIRRMNDSDRIPDKPVFVNHTAYYCREKIMAWLATNPPIRKQTDKKDKSREPFQYNDKLQKQIILFCQPGLRNRGLSYEP